MAVERPPFSRPRRQRVIAGVCAGIARHYGWSRSLVRLGFLVSCLLPGPQVVLYIALWILMPKDPKGVTR
jgi:phage shock protein PspC (stress-responsive transcriptional regulator)